MQLLKWLSITDRFYKIYLDKQLAPFGINNSQYMFLIKICHSPGILQDSLLDMFYVHPSNIVRTVAALEKQGMITRAPHEKDKRTCKLYPTERALSVIDEIQTICEKTESLLLQGISKSDQNLFMDFLIQAGKNITSELHIERKEEEFNLQYCGSDFYWSGSRLSGKCSNQCCLPVLYHLPCHCTAGRNWQCLPCFPLSWTQRAESCRQSSGKWYCSDGDFRNYLFAGW